MYVNTFAKSLAPGLRIGYLVLPNALMARYRERFSRYSSTVPSFDQYTLAAFMHTGGFERHISRSRKVYQERRDALMAALDRELADLPHEVSRSEAGLHLLLAEDNELNSEIATTLLEEQVPASPPLRTADWRWRPSRTQRRAPMTRF